MKPVLSWVAGNPTRAAAIGAAVVSLLAAFGVPGAIVAALGAVLTAALGVPVYNAVSPLPHVVAAVREASHEAAQATAQALGEETVGAVGALPETAIQVADRVAGIAAEGTLRSLGVKRKDRAS